MKYSTNKIDTLISNILIFLLIVSIFAFNDKKAFLYTIRIVFIIYMLIRLIWSDIKITKFTIWSFGIILITMASILWANDIYIAIKYFIWFMQVILVSNLIDVYVLDKKNLKFLLKSIVIGGFILAIRLVIETPSEYLGIKRIGRAIGYNPNDVGLKLAFAALCLTYFIKKNGKRPYYIIVFILLSGLALLSGSRKAFATLVVGVIIFYILSEFSTKKINKIISILFFIIITLGAFYYLVMNIDIFYKVLGVRIEGMINTLQGNNVTGSSSSYIRLQMIKTGYNMIKNKPILGYGIGNYTVVSGFNTYSHNNYIELLTGVGIIGFIIYYSLYIFMIRRLTLGLIKGNKDLAFPLAILLTIIINELGLVSYISNYIQILLVITISFYRIYKHDKIDGIIIH